MNRLLNHSLWGFVKAVCPYAVICVGLFALVFSTISPAFAEPSYTLNYQGKLTDNTGQAVANGTYALEFKLYTQSTGGAAIWTETRTGGNEVTVTNGLFSVMLGSVTSLSGVNFNQPLYLGVKVESDAEMTPRKALGTVPSAFEAQKVGGVASSSFLRSDAADSASGLLTFTGGLISAASSTVSRLSFLNATGTSLFIGGDRITEFAGTNLEVVGNSLGLSSTYTGQNTITTLGTVTTGTWQGGAISSAYLDSNTILSSEIDTSAKLAGILTDETGFSSGALAVFSISPVITGTADFVSGDFSSTLTMSGAAANIALGSNWISGDGQDEGIAVDADGDVGIGISNPAVDLHVSDTSFSYITVQTTSALSTNFSGLSLVRADTVNGTSVIYFSTAGSSNWSQQMKPGGTNLTFSNQAGVDVLTLGQSGRLGIGDTSPDDMLNISTSSQAAIALTSLGTDTDSLIKFELTDGTATFSVGVDDSDNDKFKISTTALGTDDRFVIDSSGNVGIGDSTPAALFTVGSGDLFQINSSGGILTSASSTVARLSFLNATGTSLTLGGDRITDFTGTGLAMSGNSLTASLGTSITAAEIADGDHGFFSYVSGIASLDTGGLTSANLSTALTDETGTGRSVFSISPAFSGTPTFASLTATSTLTLSGTVANIALGSNYLSGDGGDEGVYVDASGRVAIGTSTPTTRFHFRQSSDTYSGGFVMQSATGNAGYQHSINTAGNMLFSYASDVGNAANFNAGTIYAVSPTGNFGIGSTTPTAKLSVVGSTGATFSYSSGSNAYISANFSSTNTVLYLSRIATSNNNAIYFNTGGSTKWAIGSWQTDTTENLSISNGGLSGAKLMTFNNTTNNIGIGTTTPASKFQVLSTAEQLRLAYSSTQYWSDTIANDGGRTLAGFGTDADLNIAFGGATDGDFSVNADDLFVDTSTGNVGIGDSTPAALFTVGSGDLFQINASGQVVAGAWQGTAITDTYVADTLTIGSGSTFANNIVTPNAVLTTGQGDELCLTYETTGTTFEWQTCGGGLLSADIDTSSELAAILTDETGSGALVFGTSPTFTTSANFGTAGVRLSDDGDGGLTFLGLGNGSDEDLKLDLDNTANTGVFTSSTGLNQLTFSGIGLNTTAGSGYSLFGTSYFYASTTNDSISVGESAGRLFNGGALYNVAIGFQAGYSATSSDNNIFVGYRAGYAGTSAGNNVAIGYEAMLTATSSTGNVALGYQALRALNGSGAAGAGLVAVGYRSLYSNTSGHLNVAVGQSALFSNTTGNSNVGVGYGAGYWNTTGSDNIFIGQEAGSGSSGLTTGSNNTVVGRIAFNKYTTGAGNSVFGRSALLTNTTGSNNAAFGYLSSAYNASATGTVAIGAYSAYGAAVNYSNQGGTVVGFQAGYNFQTGSNYNTLIGYNAGYNVTTGTYNTMLGYFGPTGGVTTGSNNILIGQDVRSGLTVTASNQLNIGNLLYGTGLGSGATLSTGKIGIGTSTPNQALSVFRSAADAAIEFSALTGSSYKWTAGIDYSDAGKFKISSSSALGTNDRFVIDGNGNVGIGTSNPTNWLTVQPGSTGNAIIGRTSLGGWAGGSTEGSIGYQSLNGGPDFALKYNDVGATELNAASGERIKFSIAASEQATLAANGRFGIGTSTPGALLDVQGAAEFGTGNVALITAAGKIAGLSSAYFGTDTSANLDSVITDNTGSGALVFGTNPTFTGTQISFTSLTASRALFLDSSSRATTTAASASLLNALSDETGTGLAVFSTSPTLTTPRASILYGGIGTGSSLTLRSTAGAGSSDSIVFGMGSAGATPWGKLDNSLNTVSFGENAGATFSTNSNYSIAIGFSAGQYASTTNTNHNIYIGTSAGASNTGYDNNIIGRFSGQQNTGNRNNILGYYAGYSNTGSYNEMIGSQAGRYLQATSSVIVGTEALYGSHATTYISLNNVALGYRAGYASDDGSGNNILLGYQAADNLTTGNNNIIIGYDIDNITATADNILNIGNIIFGAGIDSTGTTVDANATIGIGTTTPWKRFSVAGDAVITGALFDSLGSAGGSGECLKSTVTGTDWASCGSGGLASTDIDTSSELAGILTDETGFSSGALAVFSISPTITGTADFVAGDFSSTLTMSGTVANIALGANYLSGDGGDEGVYVSSVGNVGIGTSSPASKLDVLISDGTTAALRVSRSSNASAYLGFTSSGGSYTAANIIVNGTNVLSPMLNGGTAFGSYAGGSTQAPANGIIVAGNVGIGTSTPTTRFHVKQSADNYAGGFVLQRASGNAGYQFAINTSASLLLGYASDAGSSSNFNANTFFAVDTSGDIGIGTTSPYAKLSVTNTGSAPSFLVEDSASPDTSPFIIDASGNVGVGTASPYAPVTIRATNAGAYAEGMNFDINDATTNSAIGIDWNLSNTDLGATNPGARIQGIRVATGAGGALAFSTRNGGTSLLNEAMRITQTGGIGIGTTTPNQKLSIFNSAADAAIEFSSLTGSSYKWTAGIDYSDAGKFKISSSSALGTNDRLTIDGSGRVGIGTASPSALLHLSSGGTVPSIFSGTGLVVSRSNSGTSNAQVSIIAGNAGTSILAFGDTDLEKPGSLEYDHSLDSFTFRAAAGDRMTINSTGLGIGTTTPNYRLAVYASSASGYAAQLFNDGNNANRYGLKIIAGADDASGTTYYLDAYDGDGGQVGYIANTAGTFALTDVSDIRTKVNVTDTTIVAAGEVIDALRVVDFNRKQDPDGPRITGFIAQEVEQVFPFAVTQNPKTGYLGVMKDAFVPLLVKGAQEQNMLNRDQETKIATLGDSLLETVRSIADLEAMVAGTLSEAYYTEDDSLAVGEIVMLATSTDASVARAVRGRNVFGVVSTGDGIVTGQIESDAKPVVRIGKTPVRVNNEGGEIVIGDQITISSEAGVGTKATTTGQVIGTALQTLSDEEGTILVAVEPQLYFAQSQSAAVASLFEPIEDNTEDTLWNRLTTLASNFVDGVLKVAGVRTEELCVGAVCVDEATFLKMVEQAGGSSSAPAESPAPSGSEDVVPTPDPEPAPDETPSPVEPDPESAPVSEESDPTPEEPVL